MGITHTDTSDYYGPYLTNQIIRQALYPYPDGLHELSSRQIRRVIVPDEEYRSGLISRGLPEHVAVMLLGIFVASRQRRFTLIDPTLGRLIGRPPTPLREVLKAATTDGAR